MDNKELTPEQVRAVLEERKEKRKWQRRMRLHRKEIEAMLRVAPTLNKLAI